MLSLGKSKTWQVALKQLTGSEKLSADAIKEYFLPLQKWLELERIEKKYTLGWEAEKPSTNNTTKTTQQASVLLMAFLFSRFFF